jgi:ABC-2 type transport system permease protein
MSSSRPGSLRPRRRGGGVSDLPGPLVLPRLEQPGRLTQVRVVRSEWTKLHSLRSTRWSLLAAFVLAVGLPVLVSFVLSSHWGQMNPRERADHHPLDVLLAGVAVSQLAIGVLGVLVITGEYSTGMIRASFTAVPKRLPVLWAKIVVFALVVFALMLPAVLIAFFSSQAVLARHDILQISFSHAGVARSVGGGAVYLMLVGVFAFGLGAIVRNTAGGIATFAGIMFVLPPLLNVLPNSWNHAAAPYIPSSAGSAIFQLTHGTDTLAPGPGLALFCGYIALTVATAALLLIRRDT